MYTAADSLILQIFGISDRSTYFDSQESLIWTYYLPDQNGRKQISSEELTVPIDTVISVPRPADSLINRVPFFSLLPLELLAREEERGHTGYRQFAFWNGRVAAFSLLVKGPAADSLYETALTYLQENAGWIGTGASSNTRLTRIGDNIWIISKQPDAQNPAAIIKVGMRVTCSAASRDSQSYGG